MKVYAISDENGNLVVCFPTRKEAEDYGKVFLGAEKGWEYCIKEMWMYETKQLILSTTTQPLPYTPCTPPIPLKTTPYEPNIWCGVYAPGTK